MLVCFSSLVAEARPRRLSCAQRRGARLAGASTGIAAIGNENVVVLSIASDDILWHILTLQAFRVSAWLQEGHMLL